MTRLSEPAGVGRSGFSHINARWSPAVLLGLALPRLVGPTKRAGHPPCKHPLSNSSYNVCLLFKLCLESNPCNLLISAKFTSLQKVSSSKHQFQNHPQRNMKTTFHDLLTLLNVDKIKTVSSSGIWIRQLWEQGGWIDSSTGRAPDARSSRTCVSKSRSCRQLFCVSRC